MFSLDAKQEERAQRVLREAVVIDSLGGYDEPTDEFKQYADQLLATGMHYTELYHKLTQYEIEHPTELGPAWQEGFR
ncbi:MAG: hypothetical protein AAGU05_16330, partial [Anaerolineaceae bacterium]